MKRLGWTQATVVAGLVLSACGKQEASKPDSAAAAKASSELEQAKLENAKLTAEVEKLRKQVEELSLSPQVLQARVVEALAANKVADARQAGELLQSRFADSAQARAAKAALARYDAEVAEREAQAKALEARGFFALKPQSNSVVGGVTLRVEALQLVGRWQFDAHGDEWYYRDAERGERYVLLRTTIQSTDKSPNLPDVGVYQIDGKKMTRLAQLRYEPPRVSRRLQL